MSPARARSGPGVATLGSFFTLREGGLLRVGAGATLATPTTRAEGSRS